MAEPSISVSRDIPAPAGRIFSVLARPADHPDVDGTGMLRTALEDVVISKVGDVFAMNMFNDEMGDYVMENRVVEFEPERRIVWEPVMRSIDKPEFQSDVGEPAHHQWGWRARTVGRRPHPGHRVLRLQPLTRLAAEGGQRGRAVAARDRGQPGEPREAGRRVLTRRQGRVMMNPENLFIHVTRRSEAPSLEVAHMVSMPSVVSAEEWQSERDALLVAEKEATRLLDALAAQRRRLPMVRFDNEQYLFDTTEGPKRLLGLLRRATAVGHLPVHGQRSRCLLPRLHPLHQQCGQSGDPGRRGRELADGVQHAARSDGVLLGQQGLDGAVCVLARTLRSLMTAGQTAVSCSTCSSPTASRSIAPTPPMAGASTGCCSSTTSSTWLPTAVRRIGKTRLPAGHSTPPTDEGRVAERCVATSIFWATFLICLLV